MIKNYFVVAIRNLMRHKLYTSGTVSMQAIRAARFNPIDALRDE